MNYEVTATRKRPRTFDELSGQEFVVESLKNGIDKGHIAHAYLFAGPRGVGKTSAARILAKALNCPDGPSADACPDSEEAEHITRGNAIDVIEIDGASNTSVNDVRQIKDEVLFGPTRLRYKIYIIDEVHMLSNSAFNALLKTIEEPPPYIVFIFATTEIHKVPATIRSRCQQFNFRLIPLENIMAALRRVTEDAGLTAEEEALLWIAKEARGSLRDAYTLFDQIASFSTDRITMERIREILGVDGRSPAVRRVPRSIPLRARRPYSNAAPVAKRRHKRVGPRYDCGAIPRGRGIRLYPEPVVARPRPGARHLSETALLPAAAF
jgi:DNA polymerase-3 subunit gamma/tau